MRQIVVDTETTGLEWNQDHRIIEIACVELINRRLTGRHFHRYINPEREIDVGAMEVHGISQERLENEPTFNIIVDDFMVFIDEDELIIHNAPFDIGFINYELGRLDRKDLLITEKRKLVDTLVLARQLHPGQRNSLDALCKRYGVDNAQRILHGALLDAEILADVYLLMTGGQVDLNLDNDYSTPTFDKVQKSFDTEQRPLKIIYANDEELDLHRARIEAIEKLSNKRNVWGNSSESAT